MSDPTDVTDVKPAASPLRARARRGLFLTSRLTSSASRLTSPLTSRKGVKVNIAGRIITRSDIAAAVVGSALGVTLAVVPGLVGEHHPAAASSARVAPTVAGSVPSSSATPTPPPRCDLPVAESSTDAAATAESWAALYLSGPADTCTAPAWRTALNAAAGGSQVSMNRYVTIPTVSSRVVGSASVSPCTGLLCSPNADRADLSTVATAPDPTVSGSDQANGRLRLNLEQNETGLWQVTWMMFTPAGS